MIIGFDAKRAFFNSSGLGNYSRNTINALKNFAPNNKYYLFSAKTDYKYNIEGSNIQTVLPSSFAMRTLKPYWRSFGLVNDLKKSKIELYHGLSNEIPFNIHKSGVKSVVTIHDLIFLRYPKLYSKTDRSIYNLKFRYSCEFSDKIIAVSQQTANDIMEYYSIPEEKIEIIYQGCNPAFQKEWTEEQLKNLKIKYNLPEVFMLTVGTIEERKNTLSVVKALFKGNIDIPYILLGQPTPYAEKIKNYISSKNIKNIIFLDNISNEDLPGIYQLAHLFIYPSLFEGFGIPILESLFSETPVITSSGGCFKETGGDAALYINPANQEEIIHTIKLVIEDHSTRYKMIKNGKTHIEKFRDETISNNLIKLYKNL
jgi:glycosyltransferase involved in cell wall biosynthesis